MKNLVHWALALFFFLNAAKLGAKELNTEPQFLISYNALQTLAFLAANKIIIAPKEPKLIYVPLHFDFAWRMDQRIGMAFGLIYRYENYQDQGPLYSAQGNIRPKRIWTNYHELFMLAGPRFSLKDTGILGLFTEAKGGLGLARSPTYFALSALLEPKIGYSMAFDSGFTLSVGVGVLLNLPFYETVDFAVLWKKPEKFNLIGVLVHQAIPILDIGLGFIW